MISLRPARLAAARFATPAHNRSHIHDFHVRPRLFLIDGSSQMYAAAYPRVPGRRPVEPGRPDHARRLRVRHDAAQAHRRSRPGATSPPRSTWRARRSATSSSPTTKPTARAMPDDLAGADRLGARSLRSAGRARSSRRAGFEADDVIGTLARAGRRPRGSTSRSSPIDKDFFQLVDDRVRDLRPARGRRRGSTRTACVEKFGVPPEQVVDVLALVGDTERQRDGRARHRQEGRDRPDRRASAASTRC